MNYSTMPTGLPKPNGAIRKLPVVIRDRMQHVQMPVEYEQACKALDACSSIDEGKYWSDKADALAAWAKIYKSTEAAIAARRLKLKAFRRMGELALELQPVRYLKGIKGGSQRPGPRSLLLEHLSENQTQQALRLARANIDEFSSAVNAGFGVNRAGMLFRGRGHTGGAQVSSATWDWLVRPNTGGANLHFLRSRLYSRHPHDVAADIAKSEVSQARELAIKLIEWLDAFEQALPKGETNG